MMTRRGPVPVAGGDLQAALAELAELVDAIADAVRGHDLAGLGAANERATELHAALAERISALGEAGRLPPAAGPLGGLIGRLRSGVRRNALLIERAWAIDAATTRLLLSLGRGPAAPVSGVYAPIPIANIERSA
jgi:hypothetical protein